MARNTFIKNPNNPQSTLYKKLTRLFSGPIINYRAQQIRRDRRKNLDKYARTFKSTSGQRFKKKSYNPYDNLMANIMVQQARAERYADFDQMEYTPELASALDIYSDEITYHTEFGQMLDIDCKNEEIKSIINTLFYKVLNIEFNLYGWARTLTKYGDFFLYLDIDEEMGIKNIIGLPNTEVERLEGEDHSNPNYVQFQWNSAGMTLENWQVAHFRLLGNDKYSPYGTSILDPARRIWRQLTLLEDAMMAYRIVRAPDRRAFYIDVGGIPPEDVEAYMQKIMNQMKRHQIVDKDSGKVDLRYNPASIEEDYFIPVRGGEAGTKIETISGTKWGGDIDDVKYLRDKLFSAIKIPASYLSRAEGSDEDKATLAQKDIRFARTILRLQRSVISELEKIAVVHLYVLGYRGEDLLSFKLKLHNPSKIAQMQEIEHWKTKLELGTAATEKFFSLRWVAKNVFNISDEEFVRNQRERFYDKKLEASIAKVAEVAGEAAGMAEAGALGADMGMGEIPEMGGEELGGEEVAPELGGEEVAPEAAPEEVGGFEGLMATPGEAGPGKRDEDANEYDWVRVKRKNPLGAIITTTSKSKGKWYSPETIDSRASGGRKRHYSAKAGRSQGGKRGMGLNYLDSLVRGVVSENISNYNDSEEEKIFTINQNMQMLIKSLEKKEDEAKT